ncbi:MAG: thioredoxin family protein [Candidatus Acidoferrum typicum]|nr:thioredoxin family protein [Candidatus Acidoferrum typicum]
MRKILLLFSLLLPSLIVAQEQPANAVAPAYQPVREYDGKRDAAKDIADAIAEAGRTHKRILLEVGGKWCSWCAIMDRFFDANPALTTLCDKNFIVVKINVGPDNENKEVMSRYPQVAAYPYIFVLEQDGKVLKLQRTGEFESGSSYDLNRWTSFLNKWATISKCPKLEECAV